MAVNDRLILYYAKQGPSAIAAARLDGAAASRMVATLREIAKLRQNPSDQEAYLSSIFGADATVAQYALRHLLEQPVAPASGDQVARLLRLRDDASQTLRIRMLANRLVNHLAARGDYSEAEYSWLQTSLGASKAQPWTELNLLVDRMLDFEIRRSETVVFLTRLVMSAGGSLDARIAAYGAFEDPRLFRFDAPDPESEQVFETCARMLHDGEPTIRGAGAALLQRISAEVNPAVAGRYMERSRSAIADALSNETETGVQHQLAHSLELIGN
jgi:hypothetical protein